MGSVVVPIVLDILQSTGAFDKLRGWIRKLVKGQEDALPNKGDGPDRMDVVLQAVRALFDKLVAKGEIPKDVKVTDDFWKGIIETIFRDMKEKGELAKAAEPGKLYLVRLMEPPQELKL